MRSAKFAFVMSTLLGTNKLLFEREKEKPKKVLNGLMQGRRNIDNWEGG